MAIHCTVHFMPVYVLPRLHKENVLFLQAQTMILILVGYRFVAPPDPPGRKRNDVQVRVIHPGRNRPYAARSVLIPTQSPDGPR